MQESVDPATRRSRLSAARRSLLDRVISERARGPAGIGTLPRRSATEGIPLSFAQQRLWFLHRLDPGSAAYNIPMAFRLTGRLDVGALSRSLDEILRRHESLRTRFPLLDDEPVQSIDPPYALSLRALEMPGPDAHERLRSALAFAFHEACAPFDLGGGHLFLVHLLRLDPDDHMLVIVVHHTVFDGWSLGLLFEELRALYEASLRSLPSPLGELPVQYADYALWQRGYVRGDLLDGQIQYWKSRLASCSGILDIPGDRLPVLARSRRGGDHRAAYPAPLREALADLSRRNGATLFMTLAAAFGVLLHRMTGEDDILVGTPVTGRTRPELERLIGFFVNTLVLRTDLTGDPPFLDLLTRVRETVLGAIANQDLPFERLVGELKTGRAPGRSPLIQVMFALQSIPASPLRFSGLEVTALELSTETSKFDLTLTMTESPAGLEASFEYNADLFDPGTIARMAGWFQVLLEGIVSEPGKRISGLPLIAPDELRRVLGDWANPDPDAGSPVSICRSFEAQAAQRPEADAVSCGGTVLTYGGLNLQANRLAHHLLALGAGPGVTVGVCMERSPGMIVALLGILKTGGAFVPLDAGSPAARIGEMIADTDMPLVVTESRCEPVLRSLGIRCVSLDSDQETIGRCDTNDPPERGTGADTAYVMFTSGSSGRPKGVVISRDAIAGHASVCRQLYGVGPRDSVLQFASLPFDPSVEQIFSALTAGARLVVRGNELWSAQELHNQIIAEGLTIVNLPTAYWQEIAADLPAPGPVPAVHWLRLVIVGGETMTREALSRWRKTAFGRVRLLNAYGPTETTVTSLVYDCSVIPEAGPESYERIPIGRPLRNRTAYVLDRNGAPVPAGIPGELHIGGPALSRGYLKEPALTGEKFVRNHMDSSGSSLLYKTGDVVRFRQDGNIEFLGRMDTQEKIRGYRIEPGEIESVLRRQRGVRDAAVIVGAGPSGGKQIVAFCTPEKEERVRAEEIVSLAAQTLPEYMVPAAVVMLDHLPLTPNGKLDRSALPPPPGSSGAPGKSYVEPRDQIETTLVSMWETLLGRKPIGIRDNFFELGGHSLLAARLFARIERMSGKTLPLAVLFGAPTIEGLAGYMRRESRTLSWSSLVPIKPAGTRPPLFCVHAAGGNVLGYWSLASRLDPDQPVYGLQARGLDGNESPVDTVEEMAREYVAQVREMQPSGPYNLSGACTGGIVAFEMAQQLVAAGEVVGILAMFDTFAHSHLASLSKDELRRFKRESTLERLRFHAVNLILRRGRIGYVMKKSRTLLRRLRTRLWGLKRTAFTRLRRPLPRSLQKVEEYTMLAIRKYVPRPYPGRITLFPPSTRSVGEFHDPQQGWGSLALGGVEIQEVTGDHLTMLAEPYVQVVARKLTECITRVGQRDSSTGERD